MFSSGCNGQQQSRPDSEMMGPGGIPKPKSLLSSFLFSRLSNEDQADHPPRSQQPLSLQSNMLPPSLLRDSIVDNMGAIRQRTVTDDSTADKTSARNSSLIPPPPFRTWSIASDDHKALPKFPKHYPMFDPYCTALVTDAPPSVVIVRISECLRRRSIAVEYDDEAVTASCMTVDRVHFMIQLYRSPAMPHDQTADAMLAPPNDAVIVEVRKISGSSGMSFHVACYNILQAAKGLDTGDDERPSHRRNGIEFRPRSIAKRKHPFSVVSSSRIMKRRRLPLLDEQGQSSDRSAIAEQSLEAALELLQKDRLECQQLGMERLVNLTNKDSTWNQISQYVSRHLLLQGQDQPKKDIDSSSSSGKWNLIDCLVHPGAEQALGHFPDAKGKSVPSTATFTPHHNETKNDRMVRSFLESPALTAVTPVSKMQSSDRRQHSFTSSLARGASFLKKRSPRKSGGADLNNDTTMCSAELKHEAKLRSLAMRVFCNALENISKTKELPHILHGHKTDSQPSRWVKPAFLLSLVQDLQGAGRPPSISETSYKLASVHEAALAARCLRLLAGYESDESTDDEEEEAHQKHSDRQTIDPHSMAEQEAVRDFLRSDAVLERLEYARSCGRATHAMLQYEADLTYNKLTEDDRSC
mmetsp:Transcript_11265/g.28506  ORF Transcript_11265/g.28506 Transcript_11265/m.28506 type:complete len:640 (+) Transcript_11265:152-2071(+)